MKSKATAVKQPAESRWVVILRSLLVTLLVAVGCLAFSAFVPVHWAERQVLTADNWVALVSPLPSQPVVSTALGNYVSQQLFAAAPVQAKIEDALPPKATFLAGPLTSQLKTLTANTSQKVVASDGFQALWAAANRIAITRLLANSRGQTPDVQQRVDQKFDINISQVRDQVRTALGSVSTAIPALQPAAHKAVTVSTDLHAKPRRLHQVVRTVDALAKTLPLLISASILGAFALSKHRRRTAIAVTVTIAFLMLLEIIALKWSRQETLNQVHNSDNLAAVSYIYDTFAAWLRHMIYVVIIGAVIVYGMLLVAGPAKWARSVRAYLHLDQLPKLHAIQYVKKLRIHVKKWEYYAWLGTVVIVLVAVATLTTVTTQTVVNTLLLCLSLIALLHIFANPNTIKETM